MERLKNSDLCPHGVTEGFEVGISQRLQHWCGYTFKLNITITICKRVKRKKKETKTKKHHHKTDLEKAERMPQLFHFSPTCR